MIGADPIALKRTKILEVSLTVYFANAWTAFVGAGGAPTAVDDDDGGALGDVAP